MLISIYTIATIVLISCIKINKIKYPFSEKVVVEEIIFGTKIHDPYRWMEDDKNQKIKNWVKKQNKLTQSYLEAIPQKESIKSRLEELWNYEKIGTPFKEGKYTYFYKNNGLQNQSILYRKVKNENEEI